MNIYIYIYVHIEREMLFDIYIYIYIYICMCIYIYIYMRKVSGGDPLFGIPHVEKGILACTRIHILNNMCSQAGENTISAWVPFFFSRKAFTSCWADGFRTRWS